MKVKIVAALTLLLLGACAHPPRVQLLTTPAAAHWQPFLPLTPQALPTRPPTGSPAEREALEAVLAWQAKRTPADLAAIRYWDGGAAAWRWDAEARALNGPALAPTVAAARTLAALHVAMLDALIATWQAKAAAGAPAPAHLDPRIHPLEGSPDDPAWPSAEAAVSTAAAAVLGHIFPVEASALARKAEAVGLTRVAAGVALPVDVQAGAQLGQASARAVIARLDAWDAAARAAPPWASKPGLFDEPDPELPGAGRWGHWLAVTPPPLPAPLVPGTLAFTRALAEVGRLNHHLEIRPRNLADKWLIGEPTAEWGARAAALCERDRLDLPTACWRLARVTTAMADASQASWKLMYAARLPRPKQLDATLETVRFSPVHPAWPDEGAAIAGAASEVLAADWPGDATLLRREAQEAAEAGFDGAQHYRRDGMDGASLGRAIGRAAPQP